MATFQKSKPEPIQQAEVTAQRAAFQAVLNAGDVALRSRVVKKLCTIIGCLPTREQPDRSLALRRAARHLVEGGYLQPPVWLVNSTLTLSIFPTEELLDAYNWLAYGVAPEKEAAEEDDSDPF